MNSQQLIKIIRRSCDILEQNFDLQEIAHLESSGKVYGQHDLSEFTKDLIESANRQRIIYLENKLLGSEFFDFLKVQQIPVVAFEKGATGYVPIIIYNQGAKTLAVRITEEAAQEIVVDKSLLQHIIDSKGVVNFLGAFAYKSMVSEESPDGQKGGSLKPVQRLLRLLSEEKKDILFIYIYGILIGLISLTLPLGIQATVSLISGGVVYSSVYVLIGLVILGVIATGGLQIMQITLVEYLQRRVFTKAAFEFAFRVPRITAEALRQYYPPELMNRFFDVLTIQKGLPKLLIDLSAGLIQIVFGLILLSLYHPIFVLFSLILIGMLSLIFFLTGTKGLNSSIKESKYKYKVVYWLEELARTINSFKLSGNTPLPLRKTDYNVNNYLKNRKIHFNTLLTQYSFILLFKALVTGGMLIIGTILVVQREITLGQFVASEVIIILLLNSVEKIIMYMDVVYDMLTAVDKISQVTDLPLEKTGGYDLPNGKEKKGMAIVAKNLSQKFPDASEYSFKNITLNIASGEHICLSGSISSGRTVLSNTLAGLNSSYQGAITIDGYSLRDLDLSNLRDKIGKNVSQEDIFEGTIIENILLGKPNTRYEDAIWAINTVGISDQINNMPQGVNTAMLSGGKGLDLDLVNKIILARCLAKRPNLLILNDYFHGFMKSERLKLISELVDKKHQWTMIVVSNDPVIMAACDRVVIMDEGQIKKEGRFQDLLKSEELNKLIA